MTYPNPCSCIQLSNGAQIPLQGVHVHARLSGLCSEVTVAHRYKNTESVPLEALYTFPLETGAAVCKFEAQVGDRHVVGQVMEKEEAFEKYDDAMADGHGAFLLDQERPNIFTASLGNLKPGVEVVVQVTYVALLNLEGDAVRFMLPTTIAPRYTPSMTPEVGQPDAERVNPPTLLAVPYGLTLDVEINAGSAIRCVESPSHTIRTELDGERAKVSLSAEQAAMDRDFVLLVEPRDPHQPRAGVTSDEQGSRVVMVTFRPGADDLRSDTGQEISFILDCSGSMGGDSIGEAKRALELCIRAMDEGDTFNVIPFGSSYRTLWPEPRPYNQSNLDEAIQFVRACDSNMGGTEILTPMRHVLGQAADPKRPRKVLLLTDGEVSNEDQVIALAREKRNTANVFAFGIGAGCSEHLVRGVAKASRGAAEFIYPGERIEPKVLRTFGRVRTPVLTDVKLDWGELRVEPAQSEIPPVFGGDALTVFARVNGGSTDAVTLRAGERSWRVPVDLERAPADTLVPTLWARTRIEELEMERAPRGSNQRRGQSDRRVGKIVELALRYNLMSKHTSFVAVEERQESDRTTTQAELRRVPIALTKGWGGQGSRAARGFGGAPGAPAPGALGGGGFDDGTRYSSPPAPPRPAPARMITGAAPPPPAAAPQKRRRSAQAKTKSKGMAQRVRDWVTGADDDAPAQAMAYHAAMLDEEEAGAPMFELAKAEAAPEPVDALYDVLLTQFADGHFEWSAALPGLFGSHTTAVGQAAASRPALVLTACVVWWLENRAASRSGEWGPAVAKARRWLTAQPDNFDAATVFDA